MTDSIRAVWSHFFRRSLPAAGPLEMPDDSLLRRTGFDVQTLRQRSIIPQRSSIAPAGYALVVAERESVSVDEFEQAGVQVLSAKAREIEDAWQTWERFRVDRQDAAGISPDVLRVLHQIVADCAELEAQEVFLGHPSDCAYEGIVGGKRFSGFVHQRVFLESLAAVRRLGELTLATAPPCRAALTRNFERPIVCLTWTLPPKLRAESPQPTAPLLMKPAAQKQPREETEPLHLLLVEDDERFAMVLIQILQARGYRVLRAANGEQALRMIASSEIAPDLIISDVHMPVLDGRSFISKLREKQIMAPILMLTSDDSTLLEADLVMLGANAYIRKNEDPRVLLAWIQNLLHGRVPQ